MANKPSNYSYRDSESGQYTTEDYAKKHPKTTEKERNKHIPSPKPPKKGK